MAKTEHQAPQAITATERHPQQGQPPEALAAPRPVRLLRIRQVLQRIPISRSAWWAGVAEGRYPQPVKLGPRTTAWIEQDIDDLVDRVVSVARGAA